MSNDITLEQPLLKQQAVKDLLSLNSILEDINLQVSLRDTIKLARHILESELVKCGCEPAELVGLRVNYTAYGETNSQEEILSIEWERVLDKLEEDKPTGSSPSSTKLPIQSQFLSDLGGRLKELSILTSLQQ
jgi:hypothetical protein